MFDKTFLVTKMIASLEKAGYETMNIGGSFDVVAKREDHTLLIKVLMNIDALKEDQAMSLRAIAYFMGSQPVVISIKNNRDTLENDTVYSRFEVPVMSPKLFESMITQGEINVIHSAKGRHTTEIDTNVLREKRKELGYTLEGIADKAGITKKAAYEIESNRVNPTKETVDKLEKILSTKIQRPYEIKNAPITYLKPKDDSQENISRELKRIGIDNSSVYSSPFENVGKDKFPIITSVSSNVDKIKKRAITLRKLSGFFKSKTVIVSKKSPKKSIHGVAVITESELPDIESPKKLKKLIEEKE